MDGLDDDGRSHGPRGVSASDGGARADDFGGGVVDATPQLVDSLRLSGHLMPAEFHVEVRGDVVVIVRKGVPLFEDTQTAMAAAVAAARDVGTKKILFDVRLADLTNFYNYILRDVNLDPLLGLDPGFRICVVGSREQEDVMSFIVRVRNMHGWKTQWFFDMDEALKWLASS